MMRNRSNLAMQAIGYGLTRNNHIRRIKLRSNEIWDEPISQLASILLNNKGLIKLDLSYKLLRDRWFRERPDPKKLRGPERLRESLVKSC